MRFVTTFGPNFWELYAKRFIETWSRYWPGELHVYVEMPLSESLPDRVIVKSLFEDTDCAKYLELIQPWPAMKGMMGSKRYYQWDLFKFSRKFFAQYDAYKDYQGQLFWLDSDIVTFDKVPEPMLGELLKDVSMCYLGRTGWHSCASFIGWDTTHPDCKKYFETLRNLYLSGDIFRLPEWHDSFVNDVVRQELKIKARNITEEVKGDGPYNVFDMSPLGKFAKHLKGNLKHKHVS